MMAVVANNLIDRDAPLTSNAYCGVSVNIPILPPITTLDPSIIPPVFPEFK